MFLCLKQFLIGKMDYGLYLLKSHEHLNSSFKFQAGSGFKLEDRPPRSLQIKNVLIIIQFVINGYKGGIIAPGQSCFPKSCDSVW